MDQGVVRERRKGDAAGVLGSRDGLPADSLIRDKLRNDRIPGKLLPCNLDLPMKSAAPTNDLLDQRDPRRQVFQVSPGMKNFGNGSADLNALLDPQHPAVAPRPE